MWVGGLALIPAALAVASGVADGAPGWLTAVLVGGLLLFGAVFAVNSAVHSYLILAFTDSDKVALNVGFYYMANAGGRLAGSLLSGLSYQLWGLTGCLLTASALLAAAGLITIALSVNAAVMGLRATAGAQAHG